MRLQKRTSIGSPGFAKLNARPMTFGELTVAVWMPMRLGPWRARFACDFIASLYESVHSTKSPAKMLALDVFSSVTMPPSDRVKNCAGENAG